MASNVSNEVFTVNKSAKKWSNVKHTYLTNAFFVAYIPIWWWSFTTKAECILRQLKSVLTYFMKCAIVTNLNCIYSLSLNRGELHYFNTNAKMMSYQQSSIKPFIRFSKNLVYKSFTKSFLSSLSFVKLVQCKPHFDYGHKQISITIFHLYCPVLLKHGTMDLNTILLSICETGKHQHGKDHTFFLSIKNYICACIDILLSVP